MVKRTEVQKVNTRFTIEQLEQMKTHDLADLLANVVLVLKRMPNVECRELASSFSGGEEDGGMLEQEVQTGGLEMAKVKEKVKFSAAELEAKKVGEIKDIAKELHLTVLSKSTKKEMIGKILVRQEQEYSDQFTIQNL
jgi:hypothetical protein